MSFSITSDFWRSASRTAASVFSGAAPDEPRCATTSTSGAGAALAGVAVPSARTAAPAATDDATSARNECFMIVSRVSDLVPPDGGTPRPSRPAGNDG